MSSPTNTLIEQPTSFAPLPTNDQVINGYNAPMEYFPAHVEAPMAPPMAIPATQPSYPYVPINPVPINPTALNIKAFKAQKKAAKEQMKAAKEAKKLAIATAKEQYKEQIKEAKERKEAADEFVKEAVRHAKSQVSLVHHYPVCYTCKKIHKTVRFQVQNGKETKSFCSMDCYFKHGKKMGSMHK